jgi:molecular chaperone GrpE
MNDPREPPEDETMDQELRDAIAAAEAAVEAVQRGDEEAPAEPADAPLAELRARVVQLESDLAASKDRHLRAVADLENYKKRARRESDEAVLRRTQDLLQGMLPTVDNLERALEVVELERAAARAAGEERGEQVRRGIAMVKDEFLRALANHGITAVPSVGAPFDPAVHEALQLVDSPDYPPGVVLREFEKGFVQGARLLRPARVVVAGPGSTGRAAEEG